MYTVDDQNYNQYEEEQYENSFWDRNKGLIIKIIIIILCIIVLIWLFKALKVKNNIVNDNNIHMANVLKVRLASEEYFFIQNNKSDTNDKVVKLLTLKEKGLIKDIIDANNKVCNDNHTIVTLQPLKDTYKMIVKLSCSTADKEEEFYYNNKTLACLDCNGNTKMNGENKIEDNNEKNEINNKGNKNDNNVLPVNNDEYNEYSCINWTNWSKNRINDQSLTERVKTLVLGVKYGTVNTKTVYGDWSEFNPSPITSTENIEVETKIVTESTWSEPKTSTSIDINDNNIKVIATKEIVKHNNCQNGYILNNTCYSNEKKIGNLTFKEYNSGKYKILNNYCEGVKTLKNSDNKYVLTYVNCEYNEILKEDNTTSSYVVYTYQELINKEIVYYRYRNVSVVNEKTDNIYTNQKYEEKDLPEGYVKLPGSEEYLYSYKLTVCEK